MAKVFDGKKLAQEKEEKLARQVASFKKKYQVVPKLASIVVGGNPASYLYLNLKQKAAKRVGILFEKKTFSENENPKVIYEYIKKKNIDRGVSGIMIQLPLPKKLKMPASRDFFGMENWKLKIIGSIEPSKDVDCLTPENLGLVAMGKPVCRTDGPIFLPATVKAVMVILESAKCRVEESNVVIAGASNIVGKPLAIHLSNLGATVTVCRSRTKNLAEFTKKADVLISATGVPGLIKGKMVKKGAVVVDVGSPQGDVDFAEVSKVASFITPVPGGVGPLTVICLLENVLRAAKNLV